MSAGEQPECGSALRVAVIGDVGGHLTALRCELLRLGAHPETGELPGDLTVVQVGDLVHRGPDSAGVVALVDRYLRDQPDQWVQLVGNHEAQYLTEPGFAWPERLDGDAADTIRGWWSDGRLQVAATVSPSDGAPILITHAGLTAGFWRRVLGAPADACGAADALNGLAGQDALFRAGQMLGGGPPDTAAGPLWAAAATELLPSWLSGLMPFNQIHGHTSVYSWTDQRYLVRPEIIHRTSLDRVARHTTTRLGGGRIVGVDPGHGRLAAASWRAWEVGSALG